ncbi:MAG TPA: TadE/TadG family type IV pilus assembly protein [Terriglobia bacterium]|nr:TadE/TadG family type IV pilus assembly protein [Terriglobia bacterium]
MRTNSFRFPALRSHWRELSRSFRRRQGEAGAELLEFALVMLTLFTLVFGVMGFGQALYAYHFVAHAAREGARYAIVRGSACNTFATACPASSTDVQNYVKGIAPAGIDTTPANFIVTTTWPGSGDCAGSNNPGCPVNVQLQYKFQFAVPLLSSSKLTMTSASQMVISQ